MVSNEPWKSPDFRQMVATKIDEQIQRSAEEIVRSGNDIEQHLFFMSQTREEYLCMVAQLIVRLGRSSSSGPTPAGNDPTNAPIRNPPPQPDQELVRALAAAQGIHMNALDNFDHN